MKATKAVEKHQQQPGKKYTLKKILKPEILPVFARTYGVVANIEGMAAHDYISGKLDRTEVEQDSRYLGAVQQPDGALLLFNDGSTILYAHGDITEAMSRAISVALSGEGGAA